MEKKNHESNLIFIFFKDCQNELLGLLPLLSNLEVIDLIPIVHKKLNLNKDSVFDLYGKFNQLLDYTKTLNEQNITTYTEITLILKSNEENNKENNNLEGEEKSKNLENEEDIKENSNLSIFLC